MVFPEVIQPDIQSLTYAQLIDMAKMGDISCEALEGILRLPAITQLHPQLAHVARRRIIRLHIRYCHSDRHVKESINAYGKS